MFSHRLSGPQLNRLLQLTATLAVVFYMLFIGGTFDATVRFRVQLLNALIFGGAALVWLFSRMRRGARLAATGLEIPLAVFAITQGLAARASTQPRLSLEAAMGLLGGVIVFVIACDLLAAGWPQEFLVNALLIAAALIAGEGLWEVAQWFGLWAGLGQLPPVAFRLDGFLGHANLTAAVLNLLLPLVIAQMLRAPRRSTRLALGALALAMLIAEFFTSSRAGWIACAVTLGVMAALQGWGARARLRVWIVRWRGLLLPIQIAVLLVALLGTAAAGWLLIRQTQHATHPPLLTSRQIFWLPAWNLFTAHPLVGAGPELYPWFYPRAYSIPPNGLAPHAHSLPLQLLSGSGLIGFGAGLGLLLVGAVILWRRWRASPEPMFVAALIGALAGATVHQLFDYFFGTPAFVFILIMVSALAFAPQNHRQSDRRYPTALLAPLLAVVAGFGIFSLRGAALNDRGLQLAAEYKWGEAARLFQQAAEADPGIALYWQEAAQAFTRAGDVSAATPLWQRAAHDQPKWAVPQAAFAILAHDPAAMQPTLALADGSSLMALNAGALFEAAGQETEARTQYARALTLDPASARALFWQQTLLRAGVLADWQAAQPADDPALTQGWAALKAGDAAHALALFEQAHAAAPLNNEPYVGLARAYWALGDEARAEENLRTGESLPTPYIQQTIAFKLLRGDWEAAHGNRSGAMAAYDLAFSAINDYTVMGPGTYGFPYREWTVFHRAALPSDLVPQFVRADITAEMDAGFSQLAQWYLDDSQRDIACLILERVYREAPVSASGELWQQRCR